MSSGAKGSTTTTQKMDKNALAMIKEMSDFGKEVAKMPYMPWTGNDVAALTPQQTAGMQSFADMGNAFGMGMPTNVGDHMPYVNRDASGAYGYSAHPAYLEAAAQAANENPTAAKRYADFYDMKISDLFGGADPQVPDGDGNGNGNGGGGGGRMGGFGSWGGQNPLNPNGQSKLNRRISMNHGGQDGVFRAGKGPSFGGQ